MAFTELYAVSQSVDGTEWSYTADSSGAAAQTTKGLIQIALDLNAVVAGDQFQVVLYEKINSGGTQRLIGSWIVDGNALSGPIQFFPLQPVYLFWGWDFTVQRIAGSSARTILGSVRCFDDTADATRINGDSAAAAALAKGAVGVVYSTCASGSSTTVVNTNLTEATTDHYKDRTLVFTSGVCAGQAKAITAYNGGTKALTVGTLTDAPADTDAFVIV